MVVVGLNCETSTYHLGYRDVASVKLHWHDAWRAGEGLKLREAAGGPSISSPHLAWGTVIRVLRLC